MHKAKIMGVNAIIYGTPNSVYKNGIDSIKESNGNIEYIHTDTLILVDSSKCCNNDNDICECHLSLGNDCHGCGFQTES